MPTPFFGNGGVYSEAVDRSNITSVIWKSSVITMSFVVNHSSQCCYWSFQTYLVFHLQVVTGGQYDVDVTLESPTKEVLYRQVKQQYDSHRFTAAVAGVYVACFSNEFSTFSHKLVYMDFQVGDEPPLLPGMGEHATVMTQVSIS